MKFSNESIKRLADATTRRFRAQDDESRFAILMIGLQVLAVFVCIAILAMGLTGCPSNHDTDDGLADVTFYNGCMEAVAYVNAQQPGGVLVSWGVYDPNAIGTLEVPQGEWYVTVTTTGGGVFHTFSFTLGPNVNGMHDTYYMEVNDTMLP